MRSICQDATIRQFDPLPTTQKWSLDKGVNAVTLVRFLEDAALFGHEEELTRELTRKIVEESVKFNAAELVHRWLPFLTLVFEQLKPHSMPSLSTTYKQTAHAILFACATHIPG
jgi:hypothetical protein